jgi:hypothetical protein
MSLEVSAKFIVQELLKPENQDLVFSIVYFGDGETEETSFMYGFASPHHEPLSFDAYAQFMHQIESQFKDTALDIGETINMSQSYDDYLKEHQSKIYKSPLDSDMAARFEAIMDRHDNGWTGAAYGYVCRLVQGFLRQSILFA